MGVENILIIAKTPVHPTEDRTKVAKCFSNITVNPQIEEEVIDNSVYLTIKSSERDTLLVIRDKLRAQRILDSARKILLRGMTESSINFFLDKQAAFAGRIHFVKEPENEDFLGPIHFVIRADNIQEIIDWLTSSENQKKD